MYIHSAGRRQCGSLWDSERWPASWPSPTSSRACGPLPCPLTRPPGTPVSPVRFVDADGVRLRYVVTGQGPDLVLLHTLRTQLDMFQKVIPLLAPHFRVYALDLPGHGYSDIPRTEYTADFFVTTVAAALDRLGVRDAVVVGESIGGSIALQLAARHHPRVARVVAVNPYDYAGGRGLRRSSALANVLFAMNDIPVIGATFTRLRSLPIVRRRAAGRRAAPGCVARGAGRRDLSSGQSAGTRAGLHLAGAALGRLGAEPIGLRRRGRSRARWSTANTTGRGKPSGPPTPGTSPAPCSGRSRTPATSFRSTRRTRWRPRSSMGRPRRPRRYMPDGARARRAQQDLAVTGCRAPGGTTKRQPAPTGLPLSFAGG